MPACLPTCLPAYPAGGGGGAGTLCVDRLHECTRIFTSAERCPHALRVLRTFKMGLGTRISASFKPWLRLRLRLPWLPRARSVRDLILGCGCACCGCRVRAESVMKDADYAWARRSVHAALGMPEGTLDLDHAWVWTDLHDAMTSMAAHGLALPPGMAGNTRLLHAVDRLVRSRPRAGACMRAPC